MAGIKEYMDICFRDGEYTCLSENAFGTTLYDVKSIKNSPVINKFQYISINPMHTQRADANVTAIRNILAEFDPKYEDGKLVSGIPLDKQLEYIKKTGVPYSCITYSGNKSLHMIISLTDNISNIVEYKYVVEWVHNALGGKDIVDISTKNPSRFSRVPSGVNQKTGNKQEVLEIHQRIKNKDLLDWLLLHPECEPKAKIQTKAVRNSTEPNLMLLSSWTVYAIFNGVWEGKRNVNWYSMAHDFAQAGFSCEQAIAFFMQHSKNVSDSDFNFRELQTTFQSAYKRFESSL